MNRSLHLAMANEEGEIVAEIGLEEIPEDESYEILGGNEGFTPIMDRYLCWVEENLPLKNWPGTRRQIEKNHIVWKVSLYNEYLYHPVFYVG